MQEWYLMTPETRPNITGGFENDAFLDYKEDAFAEALSTDIAKTVILFNSDMTEIGEIKVIIMDNLANTQLKSMERSVFAVIGTLKIPKIIRTNQILNQLFLDINIDFSNNIKIKEYNKPLKIWNNGAKPTINSSIFLNRALCSNDGV